MDALSFTLRHQLSSHLTLTQFPLSKSQFAPLAFRRSQININPFLSRAILSAQ